MGGLVGKVVLGGVGLGGGILRLDWFGMDWFGLDRCMQGRIGSGLMTVYDIC